jgi:hypothetical protein
VLSRQEKEEENDLGEVPGRSKSFFLQRRESALSLTR